jgi:hypothetical protein
MQENIVYDVLKSPQKPSSRITSIETNTSSSVVPLSEVSSNDATKSSNLQRNLGIEWLATIFATVGSTVMAMGQHVLSILVVWNRLITLVMKDIHNFFIYSYFCPSHL